MTEVTQADIDAAKATKKHLLSGPFREVPLWCVEDCSENLAQAFARHREAATAKLEAQIDALEQQCADRAMLALRWMNAHDKLKAGKEYDLPTPADLPEALKAKDARIAELERALRAMVEEKRDYMIINNLGDPEQQHTIKQARQALGGRDD